MPASPPAPAAAAGALTVFQFTGAPLVDNPYVSGGIGLYSWAALEPTPGVFDWSPIDADLATWAGHGKKLGIRAYTSIPGQSFTPGWVYAAGVPAVAWPDGSVLPVYWNATYLAAWRSFVLALAERYDGDPTVAWIQAGVGIYGETKVDSDHGNPSRVAVWKGAGFTERRWLETVAAILDTYAESFSETPLVAAVELKALTGVTPASSWVSSVLAVLAARDIWAQYDGITPDTELADPGWTATCLLAEQETSTAKTGRRLSDELDAMVRAGATYALVYGSDLARGSNQAALKAATGQ